MTNNQKKVDVAEIPVREKLKNLFQLQTVDSEVDKIRKLRGELPMAVQDLEDEIAGLKTRVLKLKDETSEKQTVITNRKNSISDSKNKIEEYNQKQQRVRNNREYDSLSKEIEFQTLEIQLSEKRINEFKYDLRDKERMVEDTTKLIDDKKVDLNLKKSELNAITAETQNDETNLTKKSEKLGEVIEPRLLTAYKKIRNSARNGLAVVIIERGACGGCFNKIPPQRQLDIQVRKKIIVCEYCGRILVDKGMKDELA